jgi:proline iminopeptidase
MDFLQNIKGLLISVLFFFAITGCSSILDPDEPGNLVPKTVDDDPSLPNLEVNGTKLRSETFGDTANPVIIFLHGGPGDDYESLTRLAGLANDFFLVFFDQRGSGLSRRHDPKDISLQHLITDLDQIIEKYKRSPTDKVNLICHSWGAQYATFYINDNPERAMQKIDKMVFSDPGPWKDEWMKYVVPDIDMSLDWLNEVIWSNEFISPETHERGDYYGFITGKTSNPDRHLSSSDPSPKHRWGSIMAITLRDVQGKNGWDWTTNLSRYTDKVLFIRSGLNKDHTPEYFNLVMGPYPNTELVTIENVGHDLAWVKADEYMDIARNFLTN